MNYKQILTDIYKEIEPFKNEGEVASYIPELMKVNPDRYGICLCTVRGNEYAMGDSDVRFSIQSISKVFTLAISFHLLGEKLWKRIGVEPSGSAFNSVIQLELEKGIPRNPLINAGALVMSDILLSHLEHPEEEYLEFIRQISNSREVKYNESMAVSEREKGFLNASIANMLKYHGNIENDIERVLRFYFRQCSIHMNCRELSQAFLPFADHTHPFSFGKISLTASQVKRINAIMMTCGFYDEAGEFSFLVGLPGKSGVGGGIAAVCPKKYSVAVWSPRLNPKGNSVMGMKALELLTTKTEVSIF
ncbi:glutaminase [Bacteroides sp. OttesenSCG-928-M17]|nr:glutaminase [Bacteroides sp. OttesenSCG-928-M17]MDL2291958.1 glutaminase [Bacteroides sp. OttesenSCG-928-F21]